MRLFLLAAVLSVFTLNLNSQSLRITAADTQSARMRAEITGSQIIIRDADAAVITAADYDRGEEPDHSLSSYVLPDGGILLRENIANFLVYNARGEIANSISNSTRSEEGEAVSEFAADVNKKTLVLYNPKVMAGGKTGSRARIISLDGLNTDVFYSADRAIKKVRVAESGEFLAFVTEKQGTDDEVVVTDRFGNTINTIPFDQEISGVNLYGDGKVLVVYSDSRVAVYDVLSGGRRGGSSFTGGVLRFATFSNADNSIIGLTGDLSNGRLTGIEARVINISAGKIARASYNEAVQVSDLDDIILTRTGPFSYTISGMSKNLMLKGSF